MPNKTTAITQSELESYLWGAATLLRGYIDAGDYKQFIFPLMFYKRLCDVYSKGVSRHGRNHILARVQVLRR